MEALYNQTNLLIQETQYTFQLLNKNPNNSAEIENEIQNKISLIKSNCEKLDVMIYKVPLSQRPSAKMRCDQLKYDNKHLMSALNAWQLKQSRRKAEIAEREQLLNRRFAPNAETTINIDYSVQHHNSLQNANKGVDEMLYTGSGILESLRSQRGTLKGAHRRIMDMANTLGLSNDVMQRIERRVREDKYVFIGGIIVTMAVVFIVIIYFR